MEQLILDLFKVKGAESLTEDEIREALPMERKEFYYVLMNMLKKGLIYPGILDYGKHEVLWSLKKVD